MSARRDPAATQGEAPPPQGEAAPPQGEAARPQGEAARPQGEAARPQGEASTGQGQPVGTAERSGSSGSPDPLERFALKAHHYGRISGVSLAVHAVPDAFLLMHTGVGCKYKAAAQVSTHDWARQPHRREGWTEVGDGALIRGAATRIGPYVRSWYDRQQPSLMVVTAATHLEMTGEDIAAAVREAEATVPCPVRLVSGLGYEGDLYDGYAAVLEAVMDLIPWGDRTPERGHVTLLGYPFDRYEADHTANLQQLASLLGDLGLTLDAALPSGVPLARLRERAPRSELIVALPMAHRLEAAIARSGRRGVQTELPLGIGATSRWLETVGRAAGVAADRIRAVTARRATFAEQSLAPLRERNVGGRSALFADTPAAAGLVRFCEEVALPVKVVGLRDRSYGGAAGFRAHLGRVGAALPADATVWPDPSLRRVHRELPPILAQGDVRLVLGSAAELSALPRVDPGRGGEPSALVRSDAGRGAELGALVRVDAGRGAELDEPAPDQERHLGGARMAPGRDRQVARLIFGFPSTGHHVIYPLPFLGYGGAVALGQRLMDALYEGEVG